MVFIVRKKYLKIIKSKKILLLLFYTKTYFPILRIKKFLLYDFNLYD